MSRTYRKNSQYGDYHLKKSKTRRMNRKIRQEVKTKVTTEKLIEDYHPSNVRESPDGVEIIINGEE